MSEVVIPVRAKVGYIEEKRRRKDGSVVPARQHIVPSYGMYSANEMEGVMRQVATEVGADESQIRIETYQRGDAPIEANPRHRGTQPRTTAHHGRPVSAAAPHRTRTLWAGGTPQTPEEWAAYVADFEARREAQR